MPASIVAGFFCIDENIRPRPLNVFESGKRNVKEVLLIEHVLFLANVNGIKGIQQPRSFGNTLPLLDEFRNTFPDTLVSSTARQLTEILAK